MPVLIEMLLVIMVIGLLIGAIKAIFKWMVHHWAFTMVTLAIIITLAMI